LSIHVAISLVWLKQCHTDLTLCTNIHFKSHILLWIIAAIENDSCLRWINLTCLCNCRIIVICKCCSILWKSFKPCLKQVLWVLIGGWVNLNRVIILILQLCNIKLLLLKKICTLELVDSVILNLLTANNRRNVATERYLCWFCLKTLSSWWII
jgi:hypothetical protein